MIINGVIILPVLFLLLYCFIQGIRENIRISREDKPCIKKSQHKHLYYKKINSHNTVPDGNFRRKGNCYDSDIECDSFEQAVYQNNTKEVIEYGFAITVIRPDKMEYAYMFSPRDTDVELDTFEQAVDWIKNY